MSGHILCLSAAHTDSRRRAVAVACRCSRRTADFPHASRQARPGLLSRPGVPIAFTPVCERATFMSVNIYRYENMLSIMPCAHYANIRTLSSGGLFVIRMSTMAHAAAVMMQRA